MAALQRTLKALDTLVARWPSTTGRDGRVIAGKLSTVYRSRIEAAASKGSDGMWHVKKELTAIEDLLNDKYKAEFPRREDTTFSGEIGRRWGFSQLSTDAQEKFNEDGFFARILKRNRPASTHGSSNSDTSTTTTTSSPSQSS